MKHPILTTIISDIHYHHRVMVTLIVAEIILIGVFRWWPQQKKVVEPISYFENEAVQVEEMVVTRQTNAPASPPKPQVPIPVPSDQYIEEDIEFPNLENLISFDSLGLAHSTGQTGNEERISGNPDRRPRIVRIVEPTLSTAAKNSGIKAQVLVNFTVNKNGDVIEAVIAELRLYKGGGETYEVVNNLDYNIIQSVLEAAFKWKFRPAIEDGASVGAYVQDVFSIGF